MRRYVTRQNDRLDFICKSVYGTEHRQNVEAVYDSNKGLADYGDILPAGLVILMPVRTTGPAKHTIIRLWN